MIIIAAPVLHIRKCRLLTAGCRLLTADCQLQAETCFPHWGSFFSLSPMNAIA